MKSFRVSVAFRQKFRMMFSFKMRDLEDRVEVVYVGRRVVQVCSAAGGPGGGGGGRYA